MLVFGLVLASLACDWLLQALALLLVIGGRDLSSNPGITAGMLFSLAFVDLLTFTLRIMMFVPIVQAITSWISPHHPLMFVRAGARPVLARRSNYRRKRISSG